MRSRNIINKFSQHIPNFVDGINPFNFEFQNTEDLLNNEWIKSWQNTKDFSGFSISDNYLMAEFKGGYEWWVLGYIKFPHLVELPKWQAKYHE